MIYGFTHLSSVFAVSFVDAKNKRKVSFSSLALAICSLFVPTTDFIARKMSSGKGHLTSSRLKGKRKAERPQNIIESSVSKPVPIYGCFLGPTVLKLEGKSREKRLA